MMGLNFLLNSETAKKLYTSVKELPVIDYHNHLSVEDITSNKRFLDVYNLWVESDPYKHRAMRMCGVEELYITGDATNEEKFVKWCETLPKLQLNPLSHWSMMEIEKVFGIIEPINGQNARKIYEECNRYLREHNVTSQTLLSLFNVEYACPCASLIDDVACFEKNKSVAPSLRGDDIVQPTVEFIKSLECSAERKIESLSDFEAAIEKRLTDFQRAGCIFSDHALDDGFVFYPDDGANGGRFLDLLDGKLDGNEYIKLTSYILFLLGRLYAKHGFIVQLHIGAQRFTSSKLRGKVGPAGGFAGIGNSVNARSLTRFLDSVDCLEYGLPKTVLFTLNPADNALISVLSGSYAKDGVSGLVTQGPAWWWCDHKLGIVEMLENTSTFGVLSNFIGMTTDSRSFLSFARHDYFRRVLCDWLGKKWENGELLCDMSQVEALAKDLCYKNAKKELALEGSRNV